MNLNEGLAREIARVTELRCNLQSSVDLHPATLVAPLVAIMSNSIERACVAMGNGDVVDMISALKDLKGFES